MATISAAFNTSKDSPGFTITTSGLTGFTKYRIMRVDQGGVYPETPVRGANLVNVISDAPVLTDYECPINTEVKYRLELYTGTVLTTTVLSSAVTIDSDDAVFDVGYNNFWIKNVLNPSQSLAVIIGDFSETSYDPSILGQYKVLGRRNPVVFTDVWGARSGDFPVYSLNYVGIQTDIYALETLLTSGDPLLFQSAIQNAVIRDMYFTVTGLGRHQGDKLSPNFLPTMTYNVSFQETDPPSFTGQNFTIGTWGDLKDDPSADAASWTAVAAAHATFGDVLNHYSG